MEPKGLCQVGRGWRGHVVIGLVWGCPAKDGFPRGGHWSSYIPGPSCNCPVPSPAVSCPPVCPLTVPHWPLKDDGRNCPAVPPEKHGGGVGAGQPSGPLKWKGVLMGQGHPTLCWDLSLSTLERVPWHRAWCLWEVVWRARCGGRDCTCGVGNWKPRGLSHALVPL